MKTNKNYKKYLIIFGFKWFIHFSRQCFGNRIMPWVDSRLNFSEICVQL